jgi:hypothetical protein
MNRKSVTGTIEFLEIVFIFFLVLYHLFFKTTVTHATYLPNHESYSNQFRWIFAIIAIAACVLYKFQKKLTHPNLIFSSIISLGFLLAMIFTWYGGDPLPHTTPFGSNSSLGLVLILYILHNVILASIKLSESRPSKISKP